MVRYRLLKDRFEHKAGETIYECHLCDYGCAADDTRDTGVEHKSMTLDRANGYPFFTVPVTDMEKISD